MNDLTIEKLACHKVMENTVIYHDSGDWEQFATVRHEDGWMTATWFQGPPRDFIEASQVLFDQGLKILHLLGGWTCDVVGQRAISQVKMTINQRALVEVILCLA